MRRFVQLKHYAVFLLMFIVPIVILFVIILFVKVINIPVLAEVSPLSIIIIFSGWFSWMYAAGTMLYKRLYDLKAMSLTRFKWLLVIPIIYLLLVLIYGIFFDNPDDVTYNKTAIGQNILVIIALGLFCVIFCLLYTFYFVAKCLRIVQYQRKVRFKEYAGLFFLFWILPVGIWFLQPKINKVFSEDEYELGSDIPVQKPTNTI